MKVYTTVPSSLLAYYNKVMEDNFEEPYMIECGDIHDCSRDVLLDTAWCEANPNAPTSWPDCQQDPQEYVFDASFLVEEVRYNLIEKQCYMADDMVENGDWTQQKAEGMKRRNRRIVEEFRIAAAKAENKTPWFVAKIVR